MAIADILAFKAKPTKANLARLIETRKKTEDKANGKEKIEM